MPLQVHENTTYTRAQEFQSAFLVNPGKIPTDIVAGIQDGTYPSTLDEHGFRGPEDRLTRTTSFEELTQTTGHVVSYWQTRTLEQAHVKGVTVRKVDQRYLNEGEFESMWPATEGSRVTVRRHHIPELTGNSPRVYLDVYEGVKPVELGSAGSPVIAVVTFANPDQLTKFRRGSLSSTKPDWLGRNITNEFSPPPDRLVGQRTGWEKGRAIPLLRRTARVPERTK